MDDAGFADWYATLRPRLANALLLVYSDRDLVADAVDEAFARALAAWGRVRDMGNRDGWAYRVAVNVVRRGAKRARREHQAVIEPIATSSGTTSEIEVWRLVAALPPRQREVVVLRYLIDLDETAIGQAMGVSRSTVSSALTHAHRHLAAMLAEDEEHDRD